MSEYEKRLADLEKKIESAKVSPWNKISIGTIITMAVLIVGSSGSWFTLRAEVAGLKEDLVKVERIQEKQQETSQEIQLKAVADSANIQYVRDKVDSLDEKLDRILGE